MPGGEDYPSTLMEFEDRFATDDACADYLVALRWPDGFLCSRCEGRKAWRTTRLRLECAACHFQVSVTAGTIFHKTRKPLRMWFRTMWWVTSQKYGANALGLQRVLGLGSYQTAWSWLHKLRRAMVRPGRDRLSQVVEVDETYVGGPEEGVCGRETDTKAIVVIAAQEDGRGIGRIRLRHIPDVSAASLLPFIQDVVVPGAEVHTDGWPGYHDVAKLGYSHRVTNLTRRAEAAHQLMPRVHRVASLLKRWLLGTHQGGVQPAYLGYYLDEFTFRFNRRTSRYRGKLFYRLVQQATALGHTSYAAIVGGADGEPAEPELSG
jgi:transposase-like protein